MKLVTERLTLQSLTADDWPLFLRLYQDPLVIHYIADPCSEEDIRSRFEARLPTWDKHLDQWLCLVIRDKASGQALGMTGFRSQWLPYQQAEVGFGCLPEAQGKGYGKEWLPAVLDFGFNACGYHKVTATVTAGNIASRRLLESCGFLLEGTLRDNYQLAGQWRDDWQFGLLEQEFRGAK
ncbi:MULTISPECIES: GNAT family N-acetyltransferase [Serratia]|jgi:RimJ/RimL family protein N-acetyltransferase|uniref:GCN5 family acetyltransferase n=1 Tax=Serratia grimesii TaxID=82995 RepID=A0ABR4U6H3_9GAMM|nr:GNAT family protein [Serratia grimesii]KFB87475.1 GCN5 family acetyltransferase [Serratia grimesii]CAI0722386.1 Putative ribosomal N-acetyltransferase YdaF [Serratia grimesii]CAI0956288.1 Putative ribosomal N-acetyltransferase YdaF [Serratia grimesii]CAI1665122.1 Putative ribosomal N-acetyltransferase YdaF [Serratia grimesii]CAI2400835.1 Putative ribosomal N-acetyltransferase YdaF [Serratia grimesii]